MRVEIGKRQGRLRRSNVDADDPSSFFVQMKKTWPAASQRMAVGALRYPPIFNQLFGNHRDRAALKTGISRQVGARYWLMRSNQIEHDASIYVARRFTRS